MHRHDKYRIPFGQTNERGPDQWAARKIERSQRFIFNQAAAFRFTPYRIKRGEIDYFDPGVALLRDDQRGLTITSDEGRAQCFVTTNNFGHTFLQSVGVDSSRQP